MELRHLRYFVAVAEEGSLTLAAEKRLHTAQPSLGRQIGDLEDQVGVQLMSRGVHGIELTAAGKIFLDHARLALAQVDAGVEAARRVAHPARKTFAIGFQTGHEMNWLPRATHVLRDELKNIQVTITSDYSTSPPLLWSATPNCIAGILQGTRAITAETALRLARYLVVLLASSDWALFQNDSYSGTYFMIVRSSEKKYSDFFGS